MVLSPKPGQGFKPLAVNLLVFQLVLSSEGSCRPSEGSPRPQCFIIYICIKLTWILYFICWVRKPSLILSGHWPETRLLSGTLTYTYNKLPVYHLTSNAHLWWKGLFSTQKTRMDFRHPKNNPPPPAPVKKKLVYKVKVSQCDELILHGFPSGLLRSISVSNYTVAHLEEMLQYATVVPAVLQVTLVIMFLLFCTVVSVCFFV